MQWYAGSYSIILGNVVLRNDLFVKQVCPSRVKCTRMEHKACMCIARLWIQWLTEYYIGSICQVLRIYFIFITSIKFLIFVQVESQRGKKNKACLGYKIICKDNSSWSYRWLLQVPWAFFSLHFPPEKVKCSLGRYCGSSTISW